MPSISVHVEPDNVPRGTIVIIQAFVGDVPPGETISVRFEKGTKPAPDEKQPPNTRLDDVKVIVDENGQAIAELSYQIMEDDPDAIPLYASYRYKSGSLMASDELHVISG